MDTIEIIEYSDQYKEYFKQLNYEWITNYFRIEPTDETVLSNPVGAVLDRGGFIYFARLNGLIIGTCALLKVEDAVFEIAKMAVTEAYRSLGIGKMLMSTVIRKAKDMNVHKLVLYSNTTLIAAVNMYFRFGFRMIPKTDFHNNRANIKMEKILSNETTPFSYESLEEYSMEI